MIRKSSLVTCLFISMAIGGCIGGEDAPESEDDGIADRAGEAKVTSTTGSIKGTVASDLFEPLAGATVTIIETGDETVVAKNGEFVFNELEPGRVVLAASAPGFEQAHRALQIVAGEISTIGFQLAPLESTDPYFDELTHSGIINFGAAWSLDLPVVGCLYVPINDGEVNYNPDACGQLSSAPPGATQPDYNLSADVKTFLVEMAWDPAGPLGEYLKMDLVCPLVPRGFLGQVSDEEHVCYFPTTGRASPIIHRIDEEHWIENDYNHTGVWVARVFPSYGTVGTYDLIGVDAGVTYEQRFTVHTSVFHREPAPEGYSAIPDV